MGGRRTFRWLVLLLAACGTESTEEGDSASPPDSSDASRAPLSDAEADGSAEVTDSSVEGSGDATSARDASFDAAEDATDGDVGPFDSSVVDAGEIPPFDWVGIIGTGQSLSVGAQAKEVISTSQPFANGKLVDIGPDPKYPRDGGSPIYVVSPLVEPIRPLLDSGASEYPTNIAGETPHSGMANEISALFLGRSTVGYVSMHSVVGWSGHILAHIDKAGDPDGGFVGNAYPGSLAETRIFKSLADAAGKTYGVGAVVLTHGESDCAIGNTNYQAGIQSLISSYNADLKAITGQTRDIVMLASQQSTCPGGFNSTAIQVWKAGLASANVVCAGPKYQYGYANDYLHLPAAGYRRLGEKYGEIFDRVVNQGKIWKPVQPASAVRTGASIVVTFDVPNPPLQWDDTLDPPHQNTFVAWKNGRGFEVRDSASKAITISSATITSPTSVTLALGENPTGPVTVSYAVTQDCTVATPGACQDPADSGGGRQGGLSSGLRGQLRDSDDLIGYDEESITADVVAGSSTVTLSGGSTLSKRAVRDVVTGNGAPPNWTIANILSATQMTMHTPWPGASTTLTLNVHHDLHNYAVHSSLVIP